MKPLNKQTGTLQLLLTEWSVQKKAVLEKVCKLCVCMLSRSVVSDSVTPWTVAHQAPLSMGFSRQTHWSGLPCPLPGGLPDSGMESISLASPASAVEFFTSWAIGEGSCCCWVTSVLADSVRPRRRQPTRLPRPWDSPGKNTGVGCHCLLQCMKMKSEREVVQSCPTLRNPMDCSPPGSSIPGVLQARTLEWAASYSYVNTVGSLYPQVLHIWIQSVIDQKHSEKNFQKVPKSQTSICCMQTPIYIQFTLYLHNIYIESSIINNLEMNQNLWEYMCRLYANTLPFYIRVWSTYRNWYLQESWNQFPMGTKGWLYMEIFSKDRTQVHFFGLWKGGHEVRVWIHIL